MKDRSKFIWLSIIAVIVLCFGFITPALSAFAHQHGEVVSRSSGGVSSLTINISILSLIVVVIVNVLLHVRLNKQGSAISQMSGMMVTMTAGMMSSLLVGTIAGLMIERLFFSTVIGVVFGIVVGYILGLPLSLHASMDGMLSGVMGGMMGAMFGVMVTMDYPTLTIIFVDLIFIASMFILHKLLDMEEDCSKTR